MDCPLDQTTISTIELLEARLLRIEHILCGPSASPPFVRPESVTRRMADLERRFSSMVSRIRVYADLLKIYKLLPDFFHAPAPSEPPTQLSTAAIRSIVLASASAYPATLSALTAVKDSPVPDPSHSAALISAAGRIKAIRATQLAQAAEMAQLRRRSEVLVRHWYECRLLPCSQFMADVDGRVRVLERHMRRIERERGESQET
ncbi:nuclear distribution protein [Ophiocordyceps camponoti-floridani]|uniref:Nuclear distribution protein n=1 Tax=Ophiocordyceps camponoti-floridani TaxID=2030778 RepID=A0A8H4QAS3_9HYPO|nr:nuclear distribution protein [Ophiocordyceps camponoti-floridani]